THAAFADLDHFGDITEMILNALSAVETRELRLLDGVLEIAIIGVAEYLGELAAGPIFRPRFVRAPDAFKRRGLYIWLKGFTFFCHAPALANRIIDSNICGSY